MFAFFFENLFTKKTATKYMNILTDAEYIFPCGLGCSEKLFFSFHYLPNEDNYAAWLA